MNRVLCIVVAVVLGSLRTADAQVSLGEAGKYAVLSLGKTASSRTISFTEENDITTIDGDVGMGPLATAGSKKDKGTITGSVFVDSTATFTQGKDVEVLGVVLGGQNLTPARMDALVASAVAGALTPDITAGDITSSATFVRTGQRTVIAATSIDLQGPGENLTLFGGPDDVFIINVSGLYHQSGGDIILLGGLTANHVLFNLTGQAGSLVEILNASAVANGTFLAPLRNFDVGHATVNGAIIAGLNANITIHSDAFINHVAFVTP